VSGPTRSPADDPRAREGEGLRERLTPSARTACRSRGPAWFRSLSDFRARLIEHGLEERVLDLVLERISALGLLRSGGRQRTDSTHVLAAVRTLNRMEFVGESLRAALEALAVAAPDWLSGLVTADWAKRYGARVDSYRFPRGGNVRAEWAEQVGWDGFTVLEA
jgi:hypothetical protein